MGVRIKKTIGWGTNQFFVKDFFKNEKEFDEKCELLYELSGKEWLAWLTAHEQEIEEIARKFKIPPEATTLSWIRIWAKHEDDLKLENPGYCFEHNEEFGLKNTIVFIPFHMAHKCRRYDDLIDWFEESEQLVKRDGSSVRFAHFERGIYPYNKGDIPSSIIGMCLFLGITDIIPKLKESLYVYWT